MSLTYASQAWIHVVPLLQMVLVLCTVIVPGRSLAELVFESQTSSPISGSTHRLLRQVVGGVRVWNGDVSLHLDRDGRLLRRNERLAVLPPAAPRGLAPSFALLEADEALRRAADGLGLPPPGAQITRERAGDAERAVLFDGGGLSLDAIPAALRHLRTPDGGLQLAWRLVIRSPDGRHWWELLVAADSGERLRQVDWIRDASYRVFAPPLRNPDEGARSLEVNPADSVASPFGWHDTNGIAGAEFFDTRGNNVFAQEDRDANDIGGFRPNGGFGRDFDFSLNFLAAPSVSQSASITNLFYWTNWLHDVFYRYGFDEQSGNFQRNNYGQGGFGLDAVLADAQDGADINNAQFGTPPDGSSPRMDVFLASDRTANLHISSPSLLVGDYRAGRANFGPALVGSGISGLLVAALDVQEDLEHSTTDACSPLLNASQVAGRIALVDRGLCFFVEKVKNVQDAGGIGAVIANNAGDGLLVMGPGPDPVSISIPSLLIGQSDGAAMRAQLGLGVSVTLGPPLNEADRDIVFANDVLVHEYAHGVTTRLTGGPANSSCLDSEQADGMGEGWSDFFALALTATANDPRDGGYPVATWMEGDPPDGPGLRNFLYSTQMSVNPQTYADIASTNQPHGVGEIWAAALWEMYWNLIDAHGFDPQVALGHQSGAGNTLALQLVMEALRLQPCEPTFLDGRDAILLADVDLTGGANQCAIWRAFAKRGMGEDAGDGGSPFSRAVSQGFQLPVACPEPSAFAAQLAGLMAVWLLSRRSRR